MNFGGSTTISQWSKQHRISQNKELFWWSRKQELFSIIWSASGQYSLRCPLRNLSFKWSLICQVFQVFDCTTSLHVADNSKLFSTLMNLDELNKMFLLACFIARLKSLFEWNPLTKFFTSGTFLCTLPCSFRWSCLYLRWKYVACETLLLESIFSVCLVCWVFGYLSMCRESLFVFQLALSNSAPKY